MSLEATLWAWDLEVPPVTKLVLLAIADYCGADQTAWPSYETLSKRTKLDRRTIIRHCKNLEKLGHITIHKRKIKKDTNASNVYELHLAEQYINRSRGSVSQSLGSVSQSLGGSVRESPKPTNIEPPNESKRSKARKRSLTYSDLFNKFWSNYPKKINKPKAFDNFEKLTAEEQMMAIEGAIRYSEHIDQLAKLKASGADVLVPTYKYPQGWISDRRWEDVLELPKAAHSANNAGSGHVLEEKYGNEAWGVNEDGTF